MLRVMPMLPALAVLTLAAPAYADGVTKTWVSSTTGNDTGTCQFIMPCKTFAYAITQTLAGGEIDVKDGGSYGPVKITEAVSIVSEGVLAQISVPAGGNGIEVDAASGDAVILQGLVIDGHNVGTNGIVANTANSVTVIDCHIRNVNRGITAANAYINVSNTEMSNDQTAIQSNSAKTTLNHVNLHNNNIGITVASSNVIILNSFIDKNNIGMDLYSQGVVTIGNSSITFNTGYGIRSNNGTINSYGDNYFLNGVNYMGPLNSQPKF